MSILTCLEFENIINVKILTKLCIGGILMNKYKKLFEPIKIGNCEIKNRFALAPMGPLGLADSEGGFNQRGIDYYTERAKGVQA